MPLNMGILIYRWFGIMFVVLDSFFLFLLAMINQHNHTDEELIIMLRENEVVAFNKIYTRYWYELYVITNKRLRSKEAAEEIIQDFFTTLWINREKINIKGSLKAYLHSAIQLLIIWLRRPHGTITSNCFHLIAREQRTPLKKHE